MLRRLALSDFVIVDRLEVDFGPGFTALTGETGAGKSILIDALQLALGARGEAGMVREGAERAEICAEFDAPPEAAAWLEAGGFAPDDSLLLKRSLDTQGRSRAWINGSGATLTQLRELADWLVDIHGQHAWQSLTRPAAVRALLDGLAGGDSATVAAAHARRKAAAEGLARARDRHDEIERERERLAWQVGELDRLAPGAEEWTELTAEHDRLAHGQALIEAARAALEALSEGDGATAEGLGLRAGEQIRSVLHHDARLQPVAEAIDGAVAQLQDAAHALGSYLAQAEPDPARLADLDARLSAWMALARRWRRPPEALPALWQQWRAEMQALDAASDLPALQAALAAADRDYRTAARALSAARRKAAGPLADAVTAAMQQLGMAGGRFEVHLAELPEPQAHGLDEIEFRVAGHAGSTPRALAKVASGGELSRLALAIAVSTRTGEGGAGTLIFDEIDAGIGGAVGDTVGALMRRLGRDCQVLAVTHLAQVAARAEGHLVVAKSDDGRGGTRSSVRPVRDEARVLEVARMLGGDPTAPTSQAHARALMAAGDADAGALRGLSASPPDASAAVAAAAPRRGGRGAQRVQAFTPGPGDAAVDAPGAPQPAGPRDTARRSAGRSRETPVRSKPP